MELLFGNDIKHYTAATEVQLKLEVHYLIVLAKYKRNNTLVKCYNIHDRNVFA